MCKKSRNYTDTRGRGIVPNSNTSSVRSRMGLTCMFLPVMCIRINVINQHGLALVKQRFITPSPPAPLKVGVKAKRTSPLEGPPWANAQGAVHHCYLYDGHSCFLETLRSSNVEI